MDFQFPMSLTPDFSVALERSDRAWTVRCQGTLDTRDAAAVVQPHLLELHEEVVRAKVPLVELEVERVEYMNSSGLKSFMAWFLTAAHAPEGRYRIDVRIDASREWQRLSFRPMERLAPTTVRLLPQEPVR